MDTLHSVLLIVDVQNDFCPGGAMAVGNGDEVIDPINRMQRRRAAGNNRLWKKVVATADWHPSNHISFAAQHPGREPYQEVEVDGLPQNLWPVHCVAGSEGADFHPELETSYVDLILRKGTDPRLDSYSAFFENDGSTPTGLHGFLEQFGITTVYIAGLAYDWCVYFSTVDARALGYETWLIEDASRAVDLPEGFAEQRKADMQSRGVKFTGSEALLE